ncbi:MAG: ABC transporter substrate-binding protein [Bacteroidetes bacterium]|nr:ABC transporter substrate-binding protein [Bacteroidota bacterium]
MQKLLLLLIFFLLIISCKEVQKPSSSSTETEKAIQITYAKGFEIQSFNEYKVITLKNVWPGSEREFKYALIEKGATLPSSETFDAIIEIPVKKIVVTSTTHIPSLEMLGVEESLVGFPNLDYISSIKTRKRIAEDAIVELGRNEDINTEVLINLSPDLVVGFAVDGVNKTLSIIKKTGIPIVYNGDWTETSPLGKAEWIKFFGVFFKKEKEADSIFSEIMTQYLIAKEKALKAKNRPTVLSGAMYKDVWHLPQGNSWAAQFIADANGEYLWKESEGTGSLSLNLENVLEKGVNADYWIGPGYFSSLQQLKDTHNVYIQFDAFKNENVYNFTNKKGETGGLLYFELAPNRPDIVLKDIIKILHPELLPEHELFFFDKLQ